MTAPKPRKFPVSRVFLFARLDSRIRLERVPDPADRRAKVVRLTSRGQEVEQTVRLVIQEIELD
jgi:DNA-binding MarR family transcriptional regulator